MIEDNWALHLSARSNLCSEHDPNQSGAVRFHHDCARETEPIPPGPEPFKARTWVCLKLCCSRRIAQCFTKVRDTYIAIRVTCDFLQIKNTLTMLSYSFFDLISKLENFPQIKNICHLRRDKATATRLTSMSAPIYNCSFLSLMSLAKEAYTWALNSPPRLRN